MGLSALSGEATADFGDPMGDFEVPGDLGDPTGDFFEVPGDLGEPTGGDFSLLSMTGNGDVKGMEQVWGTIMAGLSILVPGIEEAGYATEVAGAPNAGAGDPGRVAAPHTVWWGVGACSSITECNVDGAMRRC